MILDCGCGTGANVAWLREFGDHLRLRPDVERPGAWARQMGRRTWRAPASRPIPFPDACVDLATSFDVFQCLPDAGGACGHPRDVPGPEAGRPSDSERRGARLLRGQSRRALRGSPALHAGAAATDRLRQAGFTIERLTFVQCERCFPLMLPVRVAQRWRSGGAQCLPASSTSACQPRR